MSIIGLNWYPEAQLGSEQIMSEEGNPTGTDLLRLLTQILSSKSDDPVKINSD